MSKYFITFYYIFWARVLVIVIVYCLILVSILQDVQTKMHLLSSFEFLTLGGVFLEVKNNYKKILGCLAKFLVNGHCLSEKCRIFGVFMSNGHVNPSLVGEGGL